MDDYIHGKNVTYSDGLLVTATTDYQISVRSTDANFSSLEGSSLPLDVVKLHLSGSAGTSVPATLSTESKTIFRGGVSTGNETATFNIIYSTQPNDYRLYDASSNLYGTSLIYEITPQ